MGHLFLNVFFITLIIFMDLSAFILWGYSEESNFSTDDGYPVIGSQNNPFSMLKSTESDIRRVEVAVEKLNSTDEPYNVTVIIDAVELHDPLENNFPMIGNFSRSFNLSPESPVEVNLTVSKSNLTDINFHLQIKLFKSTHPYRTYSYLLFVATFGLFVLFLRSLIQSFSEEFVKEYEQRLKEEKREDQF